LKTMNKTDYIKLGNDFCAKYDVKIIKNYVGTKKYFPSDKEIRDVYEIIITRGNKHFTFPYGDSIVNTEKNRNSQVRKYPSNYDILACLEKYEYDDIDDFASSLGIEKPSEAIRLFEVCNKQVRDVANMFSFAELSELRDIQ